MVEAMPTLPGESFVDVIDVCDSRVDWSKVCLKVISADYQDVTSHLLPAHYRNITSNL